MSERPDQAIELIGERIEALSGGEPGIAAQWKSHAINVARMSPHARRLVGEWREDLAALVAGGETDPLVLASVAADMAMAGDPAGEMGELAERASSAFAPSAFAMWSNWAPYIAVRSLGVAERFEAAKAILDGALSEATAHGWAPAVSVLSSFRSELIIRLGDLTGAEEDARVALELASTHGPPVGIPAAVAWLSDSLVEQGRLEEAAALFAPEPFATSPASVPEAYTMYFILSSRGRLRFAEGRFEESAEDLLECGRRVVGLGEVNPALIAWRRGAALALLAGGHRKRAAELANEELALARHFGGVRAIGVALRVAGLVEGGAAGMLLLRESAATLAVSPARLERARALVDLGAALRRAGERGEALETLALGMDLADRCGATPLADRARDEMVVAGARPRRRAITGRGALTASELRVAELAAGGLTNKEIAQARFVTLRTVEMHLSNAYRKLEISSRQELGAALSDDERSGCA
jgi:DNA-binding NarL/FixJ family response regulator